MVLPKREFDSSLKKSTSKEFVALALIIELKFNVGPNEFALMKMQTPMNGLDYETFDNVKLQDSVM